MAQSSRKQLSISKQIILFICVIALGLIVITPSIYTKQLNSLMSQRDESLNSNTDFNPTNIQGLIKYMNMETLLSKSDDSAEKNTFTSRNGKYTFKYPKAVYIREYPNEIDNDLAVRIMITANQDDLKLVTETQSCVNDKIDSPDQCNVEEGNFFQVNIVENDNMISPFYNDEDNLKRKQKMPIKTELNDVYLIDNSVYVMQNTDYGKVQSSIAHDWDNLRYSYDIKLPKENNMPQAYLFFSGYASPYTYPYNQALAIILKSFEILR